MRKLLAALVAVACGIVAGRSAQGAAASCGDVNGDAAVNLTDPVYALNFLFLSGPAPECSADSTSCANVNGDAAFNLSDAVYLLNWLFLGGPEPVCSGGPQVIAGFTFTKTNEQGYPEYTHDQTGIIFVMLPGGKFNMGSPADESFRDGDEGPVHEVTLSPFLIAKHAATQGQWKQVMGANPCWFQGVNAPDGVNSDHLPVEEVSWDDIQEFEVRTGLGLPTEAQWEYASRAGTETAFSFGSGEGCADWECTACVERDAFMWYCGNSEDRTHEVGTKAANPFGLHDVHGNVWQWCEDVLDEAFYSKPEAAGPDPLCTSGSEERVLRGGGWVGKAGVCRSADRIGYLPFYRSWYLGFRPAVWPLP
jgi:formylglycine-generating enzyme required for sulfatase activity